MTAYLESIIKRLTQGETVGIAGLGDSLTYGWMVETGFFDRFIAGLTRTYPDARIKTLNAGVPGSTATDGLRRLSAVIAKHPDLVIVQFGLNDCYSGESVSAFEDTIASITRNLLEAGSQVILTTSCPVSDPGFMKMVNPFYAAISDVANKQSVPLADLNKFWKNSELNLSCPPSKLYQFDGVHPTDAGHEVMAAGLLSLFRP